MELYEVRDNSKNVHGTFPDKKSAKAKRDALNASSKDTKWHVSRSIDHWKGPSK